MSENGGGLIAGDQLNMRSGENINPLNGILRASSTEDGGLVK